MSESVKPNITIVTPSYNQGDFIRSTIESVLAQDYPNIEYIVMDGGSTDQTAAVVSEYASRLLWVSERDRGQSHAINKGFKLAKGEIVAWLNSDDVLLPGAIPRAVKAFGEAPPDIGGIYGEGYLMDRAGDITARFPATEPFNLWKLTYLADYILQQSTFFRRNAIADVGWLDESLHYALDWDLLIRLGTHFGLRYVPEYFGVLREYPDAKSFAGGAKRIEEIRRVLERHTGLKRAPGYWTYGLERHQSEWKERLKVRNDAPGWLRALGRVTSSLVYLATAVPVMLIHTYCQGIYMDGWVAARLKWMLPKGAGEVIVYGQLPDEPALKGQSLAIVVDDRELGRWPVNPGSFSFRFCAPSDGRNQLSFEVRASHCRSERLGRISFRRVSWIFGGIEWSSQANRVDPDGI